MPKTDWTETERIYDSKINSNHSHKLNIIPHCPFCLIPMQFTEASQSDSESIKQFCTCPNCDVMVYIHHLI